MKLILDHKSSYVYLLAVAAYNTLVVNIYVWDNPARFTRQFAHSTVLFDERHGRKSPKYKISTVHLIKTAAMVNNHDSKYKCENFSDLILFDISK